MLRAIAVCALLLAGCISSQETNSGDQPMQVVADPYYDVVPEDETYGEHAVHYTANGVAGGEEFAFHSLEEMEAKVFAWETAHPNLVDISIAGESVEGRPIYHVIVTDESVADSQKVAAMFEGAIHGNEYGGTEIMLFTVDFLLENYATNATVRDMLRGLDLHLIPTANPDGYVAGKRANANGVNLNRNFDVDWGNPAGTSNAHMGTIAQASGQPLGGVLIAAENCGAAPHSEPETQAVVDVMESLEGRAAFHIAGHAPFNAVITVPASAEPPFTVPARHAAVLDTSLEWIRENTEYEAGRANWGDTSAGAVYAASGNSMDYWYMLHEKPSFTLEIEYWFTSTQSDDYPDRFPEDYQGLRFWMDATLPITMHLLSNAGQLHDWDWPDQAALLP